MIIYKDKPYFNIEGVTAVTFGKFDGMHLGHQRLIEKVMEKKQDDMLSVVFTFSRDKDKESIQDLDDSSLIPAGKSEGRQILTSREREVHLEKMGIDVLIEYPFSDQLRHMEPEDFIEEIVVKQIHPSYIAVGSDFRFGYERRGNAALLKAMERKYGFQVDVIEKERYEMREISSTYVREEIAAGHMEKAFRLLGYPYYVYGEVVHGKEIGRTLGLPTINIIPEKQKLLPPNGVYLTKTNVFGKDYFGITNIGVKPTIQGENKKGVETYIFDYSGDLYGKRLMVTFYSFERAEVKFASLMELKAQIEKDVSWGRAKMKSFMD